MFDPKHYVPILKLKAGELSALESAMRKGVRFTPLIEIVRTDQGIQEATKSIADVWPHQHPILVDTLYVEDHPTFGDTAIEVISQHANNSNLTIIPVTGNRRTPIQIESVAKTASIHQKGACIRLTPVDIDEPESVDASCVELARAISLPVDQIHVLIDLGEINERYTSAIRRQVVDAINASPFIQAAASLVVAGGSFPQSMANIDSGAITPIVRPEWTLWNSIKSHAQKPQRIPAFGDYTAANPTPLAFDPEKMTPAAKIIYTTDHVWLIFKGRSLRSEDGFSQYHALAAEVVESFDYAGPEFSWGDKYIHDCAKRLDGPGNLTTWVSVKTSHHIAHVVNQISSPPAT